MDEFYSRIFDSAAYVDLENVVRLVLLLSHGNARVESGFSINSDILLENMLKETIVSRRIVYEGVHRSRGPTKVEIPPEMLKMVGTSRRRYKSVCTEKTKQQSEGQKRKVTIDMKNVVARKKEIVDDMKGKIMQFDAEIYSLQEQLKE